jgi:hypothetical protein
MARNIRVPNFARKIDAIWQPVGVFNFTAPLGNQQQRSTTGIAAPTSRCTQDCFVHQHCRNLADDCTFRRVAVCTHAYTFRFSCLFHFSHIQDDISYVVDTGRAKIKDYDPHLNTSTLQTSWISQASAKQRKGRAGRVKPGVCFHLFSRDRHLSMRPFLESELLRTPLVSHFIFWKGLTL